ncbi:MAG: 1,4-dihydroxy-6-naphthoate synthase [Akkermansiaceae bacterium]|nr:1,4-dihydroxy-6-naphthoate synthase [Armatimonadota bacterium]
MTKLSLGISPCPNDVYIFAGLLLGKSDTHGLKFDSVQYEDVETLNALSMTGDIDVCKISYANFSRIADRYELLPCGGALGRGVGPLLLVHGARSHFDPSRETLVPGEFTTANFLFDFYTRRSDIPKRYVPFDILYAELCNRPGAQGVVIHEKRFTYQSDGLTLVQDLGDFWEEKTGHAIPLGAIAVRRSLGTDTIASVKSAIKDSLQWADANRDESFELCRHYAQDLTHGVIESHIRLYVNEYSQDLGDDGAAAVRYFLEAAQGRGSTQAGW